MSLEDPEPDFGEDPAEGPVEDAGADVRDLAVGSKAIKVSVSWLIDAVLEFIAALLQPNNVTIEYN